MATSKYTVTNTTIKWEITNLATRPFLREATATLKKANTVIATKRVTVSPSTQTVTFEFKNLLPAQAYIASAVIVPADIVGQPTPNDTVNFSQRTIYTTSDDMIEGKFSLVATDANGFLQAKATLNKPSVFPRRVLAYAQARADDGTKLGEEVFLGVVWNETAVKDGYPNTQSKVFKKWDAYPELKKYSGEAKLISVYKRLSLSNGQRLLQTNTCPAFFDGEGYWQTTSVTPTSISFRACFDLAKPYERKVVWSCKSVQSDKVVAKGEAKVPANATYTDITINNLNPESKYEISYTSEVDWIRWDSDKVYTKPTNAGTTLFTEKTTYRPLDASVISVGQNEIVVGVSNIVDMQGYKIEWMYTDHKSAWKLHGVTEFTLSQPYVQYSFNGLQPNKTYELLATCYAPTDDGGYERFAKKSLVETTHSPLGSIECYPQTESCEIHLVMSQAVKDIGYLCTGYLYADGITRELPEMAEGVSIFNIDDLDADTEYSIKLRFVDIRGNKLGVIDKTFKTSAEDYSLPDVDILSVRSITSKKIKVKFGIKEVIPTSCTCRIYKESDTEDVLLLETNLSTLSYTQELDVSKQKASQRNVMYRLELVKGDNVKSARYLYMGNTFSWEGRYLDPIKWRQLIQEQLRLGYDKNNPYINIIDVKEGEPISCEDMRALIDNHNLVGNRVISYFPRVGEPIEAWHFDYMEDITY